MPIVPGKKAPLLQSTVARWPLLETVACGISGSGAHVVDASLSAASHVGSGPIHCTTQILQRERVYMDCLLKGLNLVFTNFPPFPPIFSV